MTTQEKLNKRRDELADIEPSPGQDCLTVGVIYAFDNLAPSWLEMYEAQSLVLCWMAEDGLEETMSYKMLKTALAEADKFLGGE